MSHPKYDLSLVDRLFHLNKIAQVRCHRFLAQDMISLSSKGQDDILVHVVLYSDDDSICQALSDRLERLCGRLVEILPCIEDEGIIDGVRLGKERAGVVTGLCDRYDFALMRLIEGVGCVVLGECSSVCSGVGDGTRTLPRWPQPITARVIGTVGIPLEVILVTFGFVREEGRGQKALLGVHDDM